MRTIVAAVVALPCLLGSGCGAAPPVAERTAREQAYLESRQVDHAVLDLEHYQPLILPGFRASADEPVRDAVSLDAARRFLDSVSVAWTRQNRCGTCHTNLAYLVARPLLGGMDDAPAREVRDSLWAYLDGLGARAEASGRTTAEQEFPYGQLYLRLPITSMLAVNAGMTGRVEARVLEEFDRLWAFQRTDGSWYWPAVEPMLPFLERDPDYVATLVVLGAGYLPAEYRERPAAAEGLRKAVEHLRTRPPQDLHGELLRLWAAQRVPALLDPEDRDRIVATLLALQREDGGWSLPSLGHWKRHDGPPNDPIDGPSDGYATGLATFALCEARSADARPAIAGGLRWLERNQRESGRWFTRSLYSDQFQHYLSNMATAYAVLALRTCGE